MDWLRANGFWVVVLIVFVVAHLFGHGGHGGHGDGGGRPRTRDGDKGEPKRPAGHQH